MIFLIGFMGAGKTTVGERLAGELKWSFKDTDRMIEEKYKMSIREIFETFGEKRFREMETEILTDLDTLQCIVMTGGGMPVREANRRIMKEKGKVVWLDCSFEVIQKRLSGDLTRPLLSGKKLEEIKGLFLYRQPFYESASDYSIQTVGLTIEGTVQKILSCLKIDRHGETNG